MERSWAVLMLLFTLPTQAAVQMHYLHNDHLGTPRVVTNQQRAVVWKGQLKPFGETRVEIEAITNHQRFPGQRFDIESRLYYNYFRDYDPTTGRYMQSDPIGLGGGVNVYSYALANSVNKFDLFGLATYQCTRRLNNVPFRVGPLFHQFVCIGNTKDGYSCGGLGPEGANPFDTPGKIEYESFKPEQCEKVKDDNQCIESCIGRTMESSPPNYSLDLSQGENCQTYAYLTVAQCVSECGAKAK